jgi:hypothetical protein
MNKLGILSAVSALALIGIGAATLPVAAATVQVDSLLTNPSFESGTTGWTFGGSSAVYTPGSTQYTAGSDGIAGFAPDGTHVAQIPIPGNGSSGTITQDLSVTYAANTDYTFTFWLGTPKGDTTLGTDRVYFLEGSTSTNQTQDGLTAFDVVAPAAGQWAQVSVTETAAEILAAGDVGKFIGIELFAAGSSNGQEVDLDISSTPLPAALPLFAGGLGLMGFLGRRKRKVSAAIAAA